MSAGHDILRTRIRIGADHPSLAGHFPGRPVVPGVVLLDCVLEKIQDLRACTLRSIGSAKFLQPVLPDDIVELDIRFAACDDTQCRAQFRGTRDGIVVIEGAFILQDCAGGGA